MIGEMTEKEVAEKVEDLFGCKHNLIYKEVEFFVAVMLGLTDDHNDWLCVKDRPNICRILLHQSEIDDKESRQIITWQYDHHRRDLVEGLIGSQSFVAKSSSGPWIRQIHYFSSIGSKQTSGSVESITTNLTHRLMQKVMKDVWNVYLANRARAEAASYGC